MPDPIPRKDSAFLTWSGNLCDRANEFAAELNLPQELLDQLPPLRAAFVAAYHRAYSPTRSRVDTRVKNDARKALERPLRQISGMTRFSATNVQRIQMGLKPRRVGKAPLTPRPDTAPVLHITSVLGRTFHLHIASDTGRPRPDGVTCAAVYWFAGENPPPDLRRGWCMPRLAARRKHVLEVPASVAPGTKVWVSAQWLSSSKLLGPSSSPIFQYVGFGMARIGGLKAA